MDFTEILRKGYSRKPVVYEARVHFLKWKCEEHVGSSRVHELNPRFWISETRPKAIF
jgi:hypothetical protein